MHRDMTEAERCSVIRFQAEQLLKDARALNINVRITGVPGVPLAMRNYTPAIDVYVVRPDAPGWVELGTLDEGDTFRSADSPCKQVWVVLLKYPDNVSVAPAAEQQCRVWWDPGNLVYKLDAKK